MRGRYLAAALALAWLAVAARAGPVDDGEIAYNRGDYATALRLWRPLAERGDPRAENWIGVLHHNGYGVPQDDQAAVSWYRRAAEHGDALGQFNLAAEYLAGAGVPRDENAAAGWLRKAARRGYAPAARELGILYYRGRGVVKPQPDEAVKWLGIAAKSGDPQAIRLLDEAKTAAAAAHAAAVRAEAEHRARLPQRIARNKPPGYWRLWSGGCFDYVAADTFDETRPRATIVPQRNCCPGVVTIKKALQDADGVDEDYLIAFAAKGAEYCAIQFFGGWVGADVMQRR